MCIRRSVRRVLTAATVCAAVAIAPLIAVVPAAPAAAFPAAAPDATACTVTAADLTWGFKESFRSYISGTIAKGAWETSGGASYATPVFSWTGGIGTYDPVTKTGAVAFPGSIRFTGHGGLLDTTVSSPTLELNRASARLLVDISGVSMEDALAGGTEPTTVEDVPLVDIDLSAVTLTEDAATVTVTVTDATTSITAEGFAAFGNYETGTPFDPITLSVVAACPVEESASPTEEPSPEPTITALVDASAEEDAAPAAWLPWTIGGVVAAALAGLTVWLVRRRRGASSGTGGPSVGDPT